MNVVSVVRVDATHADWTFDAATTVAGATNTLKINGNTPSLSVQQGAAVIRNTYTNVTSGMPWTSTAPEPQLTPTTAANQSGTVP